MQEQDQTTTRLNYYVFDSPEIVKHPVQAHHKINRYSIEVSACNSIPPPSAARNETTIIRNTSIAIIIVTSVGEL